MDGRLSFNNKYLYNIESQITKKKPYYSNSTKQKKKKTKKNKKRVALKYITYDNNHYINKGKKQKQKQNNKM